jgi:hypothetical protein
MMQLLRHQVTTERARTGGLGGFQHIRHTSTPSSSAPLAASRRARLHGDDANLQYGWTLFVDPIDASHHWGRAPIQFAFTIFVVTETWLVPVEAWFVDKYGPSIVAMFGGVMIALAWVLNSYADSLVMLYAAAVIAGIGAGAVYGTCVGNALKWFPDRRGSRRRDRRRFWRGAAITVVHRKPDRLERLQAAFLFRHCAGTDRVRPRLLRSSAASRDAREEEAAQSAAEQDRLYAAADAAYPDLLDHVSGIRDGGGRRPDDRGPDRADRPRLQDRRHSSHPCRRPDGRADLCDLARPDL